MKKSSKLRELFSRPEFFKIVGAHNGITARLIERAGFDGVWASSLEVSASHAVPDANILTMDDYFNAAIDMNDAISIPVVVDVDQGYGNSSNVIRMVKKFEAAGIAGICMEDKKFPKQNSLLADGRQELASIAEFVGKIMAAKNAQQTKDFMVIARIEALIAGLGQEEAMKRAKAYAEAGADAIMIHSKKNNPDEIIKFIESCSVNIPLVIVPTTYYSFTEEKIKEYPQIKMVIYANHVIRSAVTAIKKTLSEIKETEGINTVSQKLIPVSELFELQGTLELKESEKRFLKGERGEITAIIPVAGTPPKSLRPILRDTPLCMLDINGKSLLQRNVETLNKLGINNIIVVTGYNYDKINIEGITRVHNKDYKKTNVLISVMMGCKEVSGKTIIISGDILFDPYIIEQLIKNEADVVTLIDKSYKESKFLDKKLDLVIAKYPPLKGDRIVNPNRENIILKVGNTVPRQKANYEFTGITMLSEKGLEVFKRHVEETRKSYLDFNNLDMSKMLQEMINNNVIVSASEINEGWIEINTFQNYKDACLMLARS